MNPLLRALILAAILVMVDALVMNQGVISMFFALGLLVIGLPRALLPKFKPVRRVRLLSLAIYMSAVILVLALNNMNNSVARMRANALVVPAVKAFHAKYQQYPESLGALVPEFIDHVPRAKYTLQYGDFSYFVTEGKAFLSYVAFPPFGRPTYDFARDSWGYLD